MGMQIKLVIVVVVVVVVVVVAYPLTQCPWRSAKVQLKLELSCEVSSRLQSQRTVTSFFKPKEQSKPVIKRIHHTW